MNLACVRSVVNALEFMIDSKTHFDGSTFIVSDDDEIRNNFGDVERALMRELNVPGYALPPVPVPLVVLSTLMRLLAPDKAPPTRTYDNTLLVNAGWHRQCRLEQGVKEFAQWYRSACLQGPNKI